MAYKVPNAFKGFELRYQVLMMNFKMLSVGFFSVGALFMLIFSALIYWANPAIVGYIFSHAAGSAQSFSPAGLAWSGKMITRVLCRYWHLGLIALPVWLLLPLMLHWWRAAAVKETSDKHLRGTQLCTPEDLNKELKDQKLTTADDIMIGHCHWPSDYTTQHILITGRAGSGKTTLLNEMVDRLRAGSKVIIHDMKGDYLPTFYDPDRDFIINPMDARTAAWTVLREIETVADCESLSHSLIQPKEHDFWSSAARDIFFSLCFYSVMSGKKTNKEFWDLLAKTEGELLGIMSQAVRDGMTECRKALAYLQGDEKGSKVAADTVATMRQFTNAFLYLHDTDGDFRLRDWIANDKPGFLFIVNYAGLSATLRPVLSLAVDLTCRYVLSLPESYERRIYFLLDEFPQLQKLPSLLNLLAAGRSKGASVILACQDIGQITALYGKEQMGSLTNNCNTSVCLQLGDPDSQEYMSKLFGERELLETDESYSMGSEDMRDGLSLSRKRRKERLILPSEIATLPKLSAYIKMLHHDIVLDKLTRKDRPVVAEALVEKLTYRITGRQDEIIAVAEAEAAAAEPEKPIEL